MFHTLPGLVDAVRADHLPFASRHGVPGDDFDGVLPRHSLRRPRRRNGRPGTEA